MSEPCIAINGKVLTVGQAAAVRVAVTAFHTEMHDPAAGVDLGRELAEAYKVRLTEVLKIMMAP